MEYIAWKPDRRKEQPLSLQIILFIKEKIASGEWPVGKQLPAQRKLAEMFHVNRSTVVAAIDDLAAEGLLETKTGSGTKVANNTWNILSSQSPPDWESYLESGLHLPNRSMIQQINISEFSGDVVRLGTGELAPELYPAQEMSEVAATVMGRKSSMGYEQPKGSLELRQALSHHLAVRGVGVSPEEILIVSGSLQALQLLSLSILHKRSVIIHERPSYIYSLRIFQSAGMHLVGAPLDAEGIRPDAVAALKAAKGGALLYTIPCFHNPTGITMSEQRRKDLLDTCTDIRLPIIEDDAYRDLWYFTPPPLPLKSRDPSGMVLLMGTMSKALCPGLRIGWIAGAAAVIERLADIKMQTDYGASSVSQAITAEWLTSGKYEEYLRYIRGQLVIRRDLALRALEKYFSDIAQWPIPDGGFFIWLQLKVQVPVHMLFETALAEGLLCNPGTIYDYQAVQYIRLSYAYIPIDAIEPAFARLSAIIRRLV